MDAERDFDLNEIVSGDMPRMDKGQRRFVRRRPRQSVPDYVDWKDIDYLRRFVPERGKIMPRRISGISARDQRRISRAIKRARAMALLPFVGD
jgi:small subunit ribosomal protein S18